MRRRKMKNLFICISLWLYALSVNAQEAPVQNDRGPDERNHFHFGLKIGVNNSNVFDEQGEELIAEPKYGFAGGAFLSVPLGKYLGLQPGALVSQKGFHATGKIRDEKYDLKRTTTYLDVPVLIELKPIRAITIVAGPQYSYLFYRTDVLQSANSTSFNEQEFKNDDIRKNILSASAGFDINMSRFVFSGRYNVDLQQNNSNLSSDTPHYKNMWLQGTIGVRF